MDSIPSIEAFPIQDNSSDSSNTTTAKDSTSNATSFESLTAAHRELLLQLLDAASTLNDSHLISQIANLVIAILKQASQKTNESCLNATHTDQQKAANRAQKIATFCAILRSSTAVLAPSTPGSAVESHNVPPHPSFSAAADSVVEPRVEEVDPDFWWIPQQLGERPPSS